MTRIGFVTIGQSPRTDVVPEVIDILGIRDTEVLEAGALDDYTYEQVVKELSPEPSDTVYVSRMRDGRQVRLSKKKIIPLLQDKIRRLNEQNVDIIAILCSGEFPDFGSKAPIIYLDRVLKAFVEPLAVEAERIGVFIPLSEQVSYAKEKWSRIASSVIVEPVSPYTGRLEDFKAAALRMRNEKVGLVIMDCIGYRLEHRRIVKDAVGVPVVSTRTSLANYLRELLL